MSHEGIDIYYICYITINKFRDCENIYSINLLYLIIDSATAHSKEKNGKKKCLIIDLIWYEKGWSGIRSELKQLMVEKNFFMKKLC